MINKPILTKIMIWLGCWLLLSMPFRATAAEATPAEKFIPKVGVDYELLQPFILVSNPKKIEVIEFFLVLMPSLLCVRAKS